ncbi:glycosyltransferase family 4 protein [Flavobacterium caeni]|uniref:Glycosyltransferase involved in cell wall bisynthesis n=1 Tax=Flavobacterium caeni TaxID=490189 RepID=A0A1G5FIB0_9FLAO|nr:glycosyltransferase family 4 protein [Flavobacterium caeni]SCY38943.1 Glycosyltransferase involved in cell wall bisynthesis [Flavobacterium caeni]
MKILYVIDQMHLHGGAEKITAQKLNYWADVYGYETRLVTSEQNGKPVCYPLSGKVSHVDLNVGYAPGSYFSPKNILKFPKHYAALKREIQSFKPDAVFLVTLGWIRFALPYIAKGYPIYYEYHTSHYGFQLGYEQGSAWVKIKKKLQRFLIDFVEKQYTAVVFLSQKEHDYFELKNGVVIPNFFDPEQQPVDRPKKKQVISLGRMSHQKGYDLLIEAWETVHALHPDWTLEIFGEGEQRAALEKLVADKNLAHTVHLNHATDRVSEKLSESEIYALPSRVDNFPMVLLEALLHGVPVVAFDCPNGPRAILTENEDGLFALPQNPADLAEKILFLMRNPEQRRGMAAKAKTNVARFKPETVMALWDALVRGKF